MQNVMAGQVNPTTEGSVLCCTSNGCESWYRDDLEPGVDSNLDEICESIYGSGATGDLYPVNECENT